MKTPFKPVAKVTLLVHPTDDEKPYAADTEYGRTLRFPTKEKLIKMLDFVFEGRGWTAVDRRIG